MVTLRIIQDVGQQVVMNLSYLMSQNVCKFHKLLIAIQEGLFPVGRNIKKEKENTVKIDKLDKPLSSIKFLTIVSFMLLMLLFY